jgi:hypothetical protein
MIQRMWVLCGAVVAFGILSSGCPSGGVGDPCTPEDEYQKAFSGYERTEVNTESKSFQCETRLCLVNHFRGRVSCPYGQVDAAWKKKKSNDGSIPADDFHAKAGVPDKAWCHVPGTTDNANIIEQEVAPQYSDRPANQAVYCSCRCAGPESNGRYCACPSGYTCTELVQPNDSLGKAELAGSYCIKSGSAYSDSNKGSTPCKVDDVSKDVPGDCGSWTGE